MDSEVGTVELIQSRDADASERLAIVLTHIADFRRQLNVVPGYRLSRAVLWLALAGVLGFIYADIKLDLLAVLGRTNRPIVVALIGCVVWIVACRVWRRGYNRACAHLYRDLYKANRQFLIRDDGIQIVEASGLVKSIPWAAISEIANSKDLLIIYLSPIQSFSLPKAAVEGQDAEGFCAALEQRWRESRPTT